MHDTNIIYLYRYFCCPHDCECFHSCILVEIVFCVALSNYLNESAGANLWRGVVELIGYHTSCVFHLIKDCSFLFPIKTKRPCSVIICVYMCLLVDDLNPWTKFL